MTNVSDGTGETLVTKVDASALTFMTEDGNRNYLKFGIQVQHANGKSGVELLWSGSIKCNCLFYLDKVIGTLDHLETRFQTSYDTNW